MIDVQLKEETSVPTASFEPLHLAVKKSELSLLMSCVEGRVEKITHEIKTWEKIVANNGRHWTGKINNPEIMLHSMKTLLPEAQSLLNILRSIDPDLTAKHDSHSKKFKERYEELKVQRKNSFSKNQDAESE